MATISIKSLAPAAPPPAIDHNANMAQFKAEDTGMTTREPAPRSVPGKGPPIDANKLRREAGEPEVNYNEQGYIEKPKPKSPAPEEKSKEKIKVSSEGGEEKPEDVQPENDKPEEEKQSADPDFSLPDDEEEGDAGEEQTEDKNVIRRDYSGFHKDLVPILSKLPNHLFSKYSKELSEWHEAYQNASKAPAYLGMHKNGYLLDEGYQTAVAESQECNYAISHWEQQLNNIIEGKAWKNIAGVDAQGRYQFAEQPAAKEGTIDTANKLRIERELARLYSMQQAIGDKVQKFRADHENLHANTTRSIRELTAKLFKRADIKEAYKPQVEQFRKQAMPFMGQNNPAWHIMAPMLAGYLEMRDYFLKSKKSANGKPAPASVPKPGAATQVKKLKPGEIPSKFGSMKEFNEWLNK